MKTLSLAAVIVIGQGGFALASLLAGCSSASSAPPVGLGVAGESVGGVGGVGSGGGVAGAVSVVSGGGQVAGSAGTPPEGGTGQTGGGGAGAAAGTPSAGAAAGGASGELALTTTPSRMLWTAVRHHTGTPPAGRTNGPEQGPEQALVVRNAGMKAVSLALTLSGPDAARFRVTSPSGSLQLEPGADAEVRLALTTDSAQLGAAPPQDDGATVLNAALELSSGEQKLTVPSYALVLTYVELEPTFGQILRAFPQYTSKLPSWLPDDANPNPAELPGVVAGTDEVDAPTFERLDATKPVVMRALARFSPPGLVPFGWYEAGKPGARTTVATLAESQDHQTNDKSRLLEPPLASGSATFTPSVARFGLWMTPVGVGLLASDDAACFDGKHRVRTWSLRDAQGALLPGTFLVGGEEAANGDYQDYVFLLENVKPAR